MSRELSQSSASRRAQLPFDMVAAKGDRESVLPSPFRESMLQRSRARFGVS